MRRFIYVLLIVFTSLIAFADEVSFVGKAPAKVGVGQRIQVQYTLNQKPTSIQLGNTPGFKFVGGPATSTSSSTSFINGKVSSTSSYSYTYTLEAQSEGNFTISPATAVVNGNKISSNSIAVTVQKEAVQSQRQQRSYDPFEELFGSGGSPQQQQQPKTKVSPNDLLLRTYISKSNLYKGEATILTIKLCTKLDLMSIEEFNLPKLDNFYAEELSAPENITFQRENINGEQYNTAILKKYLLFPRKTGNVKIEQADIKCRARIVSGRSFWGYTYDQVSVSAKTQEASLTVKELPSPPAGFSGAVGNFTLSIVKPEVEVPVNEVVVCKVSISGTGNFNSIEQPKINCPREFEVYDPVVNDNLSANENGMSGKRTWEFNILPRYGGTFNLGKIELTYFDTKTNSYKTTATDDLILNVKGDGSQQSSNPIFAQQSGVEVINPEDVRYIRKGDLGLKENYSPFMLSVAYWGIIIGILVLFIVLVFVLRNNIKKRKDVGFMKQRKANKTSQKRLKQAKKYMQANDYSAFYKETITALWGYVADKFVIPTSQLTKDKIAEIFENNNVDTELSNEFISLIEECEFAHFVSNNSSELQSVYQKSTSIIEQLEDKIK